jgi:hypothetical protein
MSLIEQWNWHRASFGKTMTKREVSIVVRYRNLVAIAERNQWPQRLVIRIFDSNSMFHS